MQILRLLDGSEDNPHPGRKQANPPATSVDQPGTVTPGLQRTPSPAVISVTVNPFAAPYSSASRGNSDSVRQCDQRRTSPGKRRCHAITPQQPQIFRRGRHRRGTLRLVQHVFGGRHQQIGAFGERYHQQRGAADVEPRVLVADLGGQQHPGLRGQRALLGNREEQPDVGVQPQRHRRIARPVTGAVDPRHHRAAQHGSRGVVGVTLELRATAGSAALRSAASNPFVRQGH